MKLLVIRLSAMGDVAMAVHVIRAFAKQYPDDNILFLTRKTFNPFFYGIENVTLINPDLKGSHKGVAGLYRLYKQIKKEYNPDVILDIHNVLRSKILSFFFNTAAGLNTFFIDKGRKDKKQLVRKRNKSLKQLPHTIERYADVFKKAGFHLDINKNNKHHKLPAPVQMSDLLTDTEKTKIGIAPFAMHPQKQYPIEKTKKLIMLLTNEGFNVLIFGGGEKERLIAQNIANENVNTINLIGKFTLSDEIAIISNLDAIISMDSANMHIAAFTGIKIISVWGGTHPYAGFIPFVPDDRSFIIQRNDVACRPCSVFGNKPCYKDSMECFDISPEKILKVCIKAVTGKNQ